MDITYRFDPFAPVLNDEPKSNAEALDRLDQGNRRFSAVVERLQSIGSGGHHHEPMIIPVNPVTLGIPFESGLAPAHQPFALVLGCADARVPIEHILDCSANDLFVVRVAGNVLGLECLGSVDYAAYVLRKSIQSVIVLAHTGCGAVSAAVDVYLSPGDFGNIAFSHAVRSLIDRIMLSVRGSASAIERIVGRDASTHPQYRDWLITTSVYMNAVVTAWDLQREVNAVAEGGLPVSYTVYDMAYTRISALPLRSAEDIATTPTFGTAPEDTNDFGQVATQVVRRLIAHR